MKKKIREMIRKSIEDSERWRGGLGNGEAEEAARLTTPDRANRPVETTTVPGGKDCGRASEPLCRVIGFIPHFKGSSSPSFQPRKRNIPHCEEGANLKKIPPSKRP